MASFESPAADLHEFSFFFVAAVASFGRANFSVWHYGSVRLRSLSILNIRESLMLTFENKTKVRPEKHTQKYWETKPVWNEMKMRFFSSSGYITPAARTLNFSPVLFLFYFFYICNLRTCANCLSFSDWMLSERASEREKARKAETAEVH